MAIFLFLLTISASCTSVTLDEFCMAMSSHSSAQIQLKDEIIRMFFFLYCKVFFTYDFWGNFCLVHSKETKLDHYHC